MTTAFFLPDGDTYRPTPMARGPWGHTISGNYVGGLLGHVIEQAAGDPDFQPTRLTVDLFRPAALSPVRVETAISRDGRRLRLVDATMSQDGKDVARATVLFLRRGDQPSGEIWTSPLTMPPPPPMPDRIPDDLPMLVWIYGRNEDSPTPNSDLSGWQHAGPKHIWVRDVIPLVADAPFTPFTRAAMVGDMASSLTHFSTDGLGFINADYTLTLSRLPEGPYLGMAALTHASHAGVATGTATVVDQHGPLGSATATALASPGFSPPRR